MSSGKRLYENAGRGKANVNRLDHSVAPRTNTPRGTYLKVPCAECKAEIGKPCTTRTGKVLHVSHRCRKRIAIRKLNEEREQANADAT